MAAQLHAKYPWTLEPLICNAPMGGFAGAELAVQVTTAGGLGFIGATADMSDLESKLEKVKQTLPKTLHRNFNVSQDRLPIGVGLLCFTVDLEKALPVLEKYNPTIVWLYAAHKATDYASWAEKIRSVCKADIFVQTGNVSDARAIAKTCNPAVLAIQGTDAGGHGLEKTAGIISLVPEVADALAKDGAGAIPLLAAGGIVDGRGVAASFILGASGVIMGTRFLASQEVLLPHSHYANAIIEATDGGKATVRDKVFDDLNPAGNIWPVPYDGRALRNLTYKDSVNGVSIEENRKLHQKAQQGADKGFSEQEPRATIWAGTGVGLVREIQAAAKIVEETRNAAGQLMSGLPKANS